ncbi:MAG: flagellar biosynthesis protein FlhB [Pseudomonadota bacterium]
MAENEDGQDKSEEPSGKKLEQAREKGQVARSKELAAFLVLSAGTIGLFNFGNLIYQDLFSMMKELLNPQTTFSFENDHLVGSLLIGVFTWISSLVLFFILTASAAVVGSILLGGWSFSGDQFTPKLERLDPLKGLTTRVFSVNSVIESLKALLKVAIVGGFGVFAIINHLPEIINLSLLTPEGVLQEIEKIGFICIMSLLTGVFLIVAIDAPYQFFHHRSSMRMTKQEVKDEYKSMEGQAEVKSRIRQLQREISERKMMANIPMADVVITNPTHFSIALRYDTKKDKAPVVVAKGVDVLALKIREIARSNNIEILESPPLARAIYYTTPLDKAVPIGLYQAIAKILAYVYQIKAYRAGEGDKPEFPSTLEIPPEYKKF